MIRLRQRPSDPPRGARGAVWGQIVDRELGPGEALSFYPDAWCRQLDLSREQLLAALRGLEDRGVIAFRAAGRVGGVELLKPREPLELDQRRMRERRSREYEKLDRMEAYLRAGCRRRYVVEYFGEEAPFERCGTCDACRAGAPVDEGPRQLTPAEAETVLMALSCVARMERHAKKLGFGLDLVAKTAVGSREEKVRTWGFDALSTYGILARPGRPIWKVGQVVDLLGALVDCGCLTELYVTRQVRGRERTYKEVSVSPLGWQVLRRSDEVPRMRMPHARNLITPDRRRTSTSQGPGVEQGLLAMLKDVRRQLAIGRNVPAYAVAPNRTLEDMARTMPRNRKTMLEVHGMGPTRFHLYGKAFLDAIELYQAGA